MMNRQLRPRFFLGSVALLAAASCLSAGRPDPAPLPPVLSAMQDELDRSMATLSQAIQAPISSATPSPTDITRKFPARMARCFPARDDRARWLEVQSRVGAYQLDDTHKVGDRPPSWTSPGTTVSLDDDIPVLRREIWRETDRQYRAAAEALIKVKTSQQVQVQTAEGAAPDFSREDAAHLDRPARRDSRGPKALGRSRPQLHRRFQQVPRRAEFHRHVHRARPRISIK